MAKPIATLLLILVAITASAGETTASLALLVNEKDGAAVAVRVALVRGLTDVPPKIRDSLQSPQGF